MYNYYDDVTGKIFSVSVESWKKWYDTSFDEEQKREGTTFETWLYDMEKSGILTKV